MAEGMRRPDFWLRVLQLICGIVAFACVAEWADWSDRFAYMIWCGVSTIIISLGVMFVYLTGRELPPMPILVVDAIWWIFWLVGAALMSDIVNSSSSRLQASTAFAWLTWFWFTLSAFLDFQALRGGGGGGSPATMPQV